MRVRRPSPAFGFPDVVNGGHMIAVGCCMFVYSHVLSVGVHSVQSVFLRLI